MMARNLHPRSSLTRMCTAAFILLMSMRANFAEAQDSSASAFHAGLCVRKMAGFYWMNGFSIEHHHRDFVQGRVRLGMNLTSSVLGSAFMSDAIPVYCYELYGQFSFRHQRRFQPYAAINAGLAGAEYGPSFSGHLPSAQPLLSVEPGFRIAPAKNLALTASLGYHFFTGNGTRGLGTIYPLYWQVRLLSALR